MLNRSLPAILLLAFPGSPFAADSAAADATTRATVEKAFGGGVAVSCYVSPCILRGDFDGDGRVDVAVLVAGRSGKRGIAVLPARGKPAVLGAGHPLGNGGDDFAWMGRWRLYPRGPVGGGVDEAAPPLLRGDALLVEAPEAASGLVYWDGGRFRWYQQGD